MRHNEHNSTTPLPRGRAAFEELAPLAQALAGQRPLPADAEALERAVAQMLEIGQWARGPEQQQRFERLPLQEFNVANITLLVQASTAALELLRRPSVGPADAFEGLWVLMSDSYEEVCAAARFLFRHEPEELPPLSSLHELIGNSAHDGDGSSRAPDS